MVCSRASVDRVMRRVGIASGVSVGTDCSGGGMDVLIFLFCNFSSFMKGHGKVKGLRRTIGRSFGHSIIYHG